MNGWINLSLKPISVGFILVLEETPLFIHFFCSDFIAEGD